MVYCGFFIFKLFSHRTRSQGLSSSRTWERGCFATRLTSRKSENSTVTSLLWSSLYPVREDPGNEVVETVDQYPADLFGTETK